MKQVLKALPILLLILCLTFALCGCDYLGIDIGRFVRKQYKIDITLDSLDLSTGAEIVLPYNVDPSLTGDVVWTTNDECVLLDGNTVRTVSAGTAIVTATIGEYSDSVILVITGETYLWDDDGNDSGIDVSTGGNNSGDDIGNAGNTDGPQDSNDIDTPIGGDDKPDVGGNTDTPIGGDDKPDVGGDDKPIGGNDDPPVVPATDPYVGMTSATFYRNYQPATSYQDSVWRTQHGFMSGSIATDSATITRASNAPKQSGKYVRNTSTQYGDNGNSYYVVDATGKVVNTIYRGGGYITKEEVAAYVMAFGDIPGNYVESKEKDGDNKPSANNWGKYLRLNHSYFSGDTSRYPYEPELPNATGCGGSLSYYEIDIGFGSYNNGTTFGNRGTCRIVYSRYNNGKDITSPNQRYVFFTGNHYNDFTEYLNYQGGWGTTFGQESGGGERDDKNNPRPTQYAQVVRRSFVA